LIEKCRALGIQGIDAAALRLLVAALSSGIAGAPNCLIYSPAALPLGLRGLVNEHRQSGQCEDQNTLRAGNLGWRNRAGHDAGRSVGNGSMTISRRRRRSDSSPRI
jgi:hypothetical protein